MGRIQSAGNTNRVGNTGGCQSCRNGACSSCKNCPSCAKDRGGAQSTLQQLKQMLAQDPQGTKQGVNDAFGSNGDLQKNQILMKILGMLGIQPQG